MVDTKPTRSETKWCPRCEQNKSVAQFSFNRARRSGRGGLKAYCRKCSYDYGRERILRRKAKIDQVKLERGCARCGYREHPVALDFDHLPGHQKYMSVSEMMTCSEERIMAEIAKCQVLCSNCHKIISYERGRDGDNTNE